MTTGTLALKRRNIALALILAAEPTPEYLAAVRQGRAQMAILTNQIEQRLQTEPKGKENEQSVSNE